MPLSGIVLVTGGAGFIGSHIAAALAGAGARVRVLDDLSTGYAENLEAIGGDVDFVRGSVAEPDVLRRALEGVEVVFHEAAIPSVPRSVDNPRETHDACVEGTFALLLAARDAGVRRVVYASSHHVVGLHPRAPHGPRMGDTAILRPDSRYAVGKAFGESLGALYAYKYGMQVLAVRIGNVNTRPIDRRRLGSWVSWRDLAQLVAIGIEREDLVFEIVYGVSDATGRHYDNASAHALGYLPEDGSEGWDDEVLREDPLPEPGSKAARSAAEVSLGGQFSQSEYEGDTDRLLPRTRSAA